MSQTFHIKSLTEDSSYNIEDNSTLSVVSVVFVSLLFIVTLIVVPTVLRFTFSRPFAYLLIANYVLFLLVCILAEANVFD